MSIPKKNRLSVVLMACVAFAASTCLAADPSIDEVRAAVKAMPTDASNFQERFEALKAWMDVLKNNAKETGRSIPKLPSLDGISQKDDPAGAAARIDRIFDMLEKLDLTETESVTLSVPEYEQVQTHIHRPKGKGPWPAVILIGQGCETSISLAADGFIVTHVNPAEDTPDRYRRNPPVGSGWNEELGYAGQDAIYLVAKHFIEREDVDKQNVGIVTSSFGIAGGTGALARHPDLKVKYLIDCEGPSGPSNLPYVPPNHPLVKLHPATDEAWWKERTASEFVKKIRCRYLRVQGETDHVQGLSKVHACEMLNNALAGGVPWTRCNDNPPNITYDPTHPEQYKWNPGKPSAIDRTALVTQYVKEMAGMPSRDA